MVVPVTPADLDALLVAAVDALAQASPAGSACAQSKAGVAVPAAKYAEGRWAALREVQRATGGSDDLESTTRDAVCSWSSDLERLRRVGAGADWIAYRTGGLDALHDLLGGDVAERA